MSEQALTGLGCPRCGGMVPIPEGQAIVICPYCDLRSVVSTAADGPQAGGEQAAERRRGVRRYQAPLRVRREDLMEPFRRFLSGRISVARDAAQKAQVSDVFLVHLPFWAAWGRGVAYAFGQQRVGSGDHKRYEPREKKVIKEMAWNGPACEVGEFGVRQIHLSGCPLEPFNAAQLHASGMVFEPVGSAEEALETARQSFEAEVKSAAELSRVSQLFTRILRPRLGLVYYPMWVIRYRYRGRSFQVVIDGVDGQVLYGKAPGSVFYRSAVLVGGMAAGAVTAVDVPALLLALMARSSSDDSEGLAVAALAAFVVGLGLMGWAFRTYRYAEHYEYHRYKAPKKGQSGGLSMLANLPAEAGELRGAIEQLARSVEKR